MSALLNEAEAAELLRVKAKTLARWRWARRGPKFIKIGGLVKYAKDDLVSYIANATVTP